MHVQRNKGFNVDIIADAFPEIIFVIGAAFTCLESASSGVLLMIGAVPDPNKRNSVLSSDCWS